MSSLVISPGVFWWASQIQIQNGPTEESHSPANLLFPLSMVPTSLLNTVLGPSPFIHQFLCIPLFSWPSSTLPVLAFQPMRLGDGNTNGVLPPIAYLKSSQHTTTRAFQSKTHLDWNETQRPLPPRLPWPSGGWLSVTPSLSPILWL